MSLSAGWYVASIKTQSLLELTQAISFVVGDKPSCGLRLWGTAAGSRTSDLADAVRKLTPIGAPPSRGFGLALGTRAAQHSAHRGAEKVRTQFLSLRHSTYVSGPNTWVTERT